MVRAGSKEYNMDVKVGSRIKMVSQPQDPNPVEPGTVGTVTGITRVGSFGDGFVQYKVKWDNGRTLAVVVPPDEVDVL